MRPGGGALSVISASTGVSSRAADASTTSESAIMALLDTATLQAAFTVIEELLNVVGEYVDKWLAYQVHIRICV